MQDGRTGCGALGHPTKQELKGEGLYGQSLYVANRRMGRAHVRSKLANKRYNRSWICSKVMRMSVSLPGEIA